MTGAEQQHAGCERHARFSHVCGGGRPSGKHGQARPVRTCSLHLPSAGMAARLRSIERQCIPAHTRLAGPPLGAATALAPGLLLSSLRGCHPPSLLQWDDVLLDPSAIHILHNSSGHRVQLGEGATGHVYRALLHDTTHCACKLFQFEHRDSSPRLFLQVRRPALPERARSVGGAM